MTKEFNRGDQIMYIPNYAKNDLFHLDREFGFVTSHRGDVIFCRYWSTYNPNRLRTIANSERTHVRDLIHYKSHDQKFVEEMLNKFCS